MAKKKATTGKNDKPVVTIDDPALKAIMRSLGTRDDIGITQRCCDRIKDYVTARLKDLPPDEQMEIGGGVGQIVREESWSLAAATWQMRDREARSKEESLFWFLVYNYIAWVLGLLDPEKERMLNRADQAGAPGWKQHVESELNIDATFLRSVYALCSERMPDGKALAFVLRGLGGDVAVKEFLEQMQG